MFGIIILGFMIYMYVCMKVCRLDDMDINCIDNKLKKRKGNN